MAVNNDLQIRALLKRSSRTYIGICVPVSIHVIEYLFLSVGTIYSCCIYDLLLLNSKSSNKDESKM